LPTGDARRQDTDDLTAFIDSLARKAPKTRQSYREGVELLIAHTAARGMPLLENLEREHLEDFFNSLHARGNAPATIRNRQAAIRAFYNWAIEFDLRKTHPMERIKPERIPEKVQAHYTGNDIAAVLGTIPSKGADLAALRDRAIVLFLFDTGMRAQELCSLCVGDLDTAERQVMIRSGKGGKQRRVRYGSLTASALFRYLRRRPAHEPKDALFLSRTGIPMTFNGLRTALQRRFTAAGLTFCGVHGFRRGWAIAQLDGGADALQLKELAGWNSLAMVYRYVRASAQERALREYESPADRLLNK
jgi:site-specific recombinase XerD